MQRAHGGSTCGAAPPSVGPGSDVPTAGLPPRQRPVFRAYRAAVPARQRPRAPVDREQCHYVTAASALGGGYRRAAPGDGVKADARQPAQRAAPTDFALARQSVPTATSPRAR